MDPNVNLYSSNFDFGVFLEYNFDEYIENYPLILNSNGLYLKYKNRYIQQTIRNNDEFINLQIQYADHSRKDIFSFDTTGIQSLKSKKKLIFNRQKKLLSNFLDYIKYLAKNAK